MYFTPRWRVFMFKKIAIVGAAGLLTAAVLTQTKVGSYLSYQWDRAEKRLESKVPPEEEVRRIKHEVNSLDKDIDEAKGALAVENVDVRLLTKKVEELRTQTEKSRATVEARGRQIKEAGDKSFVKFDGRSMDVDKAKQLLVSEVAAHKALDREFKARETELAVRERTRSLAEQHLQALITQKAELESAVAELDADIKTMRVEQVQSKYQNDGTRMAQVKEDLSKLQKRIEVMREKMRLSKKIDTNSDENKSVDEILADLDAKGEKAADQTARK
jgi:peptidoglycan hydrolase CwlO-like protein